MHFFSRHITKEANIESIDVNGSELVVKGWVVYGNQEPEIAIYDNKKTYVKFKLNRIKRKDVNQTYNISEKILSGFEIKIDKKFSQSMLNFRFGTKRNYFDLKVDVKEFIHEDINYNIDAVFTDGENIWINGWAACKDQEVTIKIYDELKSNVQLKVNRIVRTDVNRVLQISLEMASGFKAAISNKYIHSKLTVQLSSRNSSVEQVLDMNELIREETRFNIDKISKKDSNIFFQGWAITGRHESDICIKDNSGNTVAFTVERVIRKDVNQSFDLPINTNSGFEISLDSKYENDELKFSFGKDDNHSECTIDLSKITLTLEYNDWCKLHFVDEEEIQRQKTYQFSYEPKFSIVVPLYNTPEIYLKALIDSVIGQTYSKWELCLADASTDGKVADIISDNYGADSRVKYLKLNENLGISENTNAAIEIATGEFIVFSDHDDYLTPDALFECVKALNTNPDLDLIYSDEDKVTMDGSKFFCPHFKPDFNRDLLCSTNYICHLCIVRKTIADQVGYLRAEFNGAQDFDFVLRVTEATRNIYHIPRVLYHWRAHPGSTSENPESKMYAFEAGKNAIQAHYDSVGIPAKSEHNDHWGFYKTVYHWDKEPLISIIIPNKDQIDKLELCIKSIVEKSEYRNFEIIVVENNSTDSDTFDFYKKLQKDYEQVRVVYYKDNFNYSLINNFGVTFANGEYLLLLNNDTELLNPHSIREMVDYCLRDDVGIVGARLFYPNGKYQHAGVLLGKGGLAGHLFTGMDREDPGYFARAKCAQDLSAVTAACMMVSKETYNQVNGFDANLAVCFNDVDFCLKVRELGKLVVYTPFSEFCHYESVTRGKEDSPEKMMRFEKEVEYFKEKWNQVLKNGDPYYNPNLTLDFHMSSYELASEEELKNRFKLQSE